MKLILPVKMSKEQLDRLMAGQDAIKNHSVRVFLYLEPGLDAFPSPDDTNVEIKITTGGR